jgi:1,4-dihydroxy-2-naphthoyl-CoA synthase
MCDLDPLDEILEAIVIVCVLVSGSGQGGGNVLAVTTDMGVSATF